MNELLLAAGAGGKLYVDDVFAASLHEGNGSAQTVQNGIDLAGNGGLVWLKARDAASSCRLADTALGSARALKSDSTAAAGTEAGGVTAFTAGGFALGADAGYNAGGNRYVSWTFRRAAKFFDLVTWTGNGGSKTVPHNLGQAPGMVLVKCTSAPGNWYAWHRSLGLGGHLLLDQPGVTASSADRFGNNVAAVDPSASQITLGSSVGLNANGASYVAYLFAHDPSADGMIQCGAFTCDGAGAMPTVELGWEPQWLLCKPSGTAGDWMVLDTARGFLLNSPNPCLRPNQAAAETSPASPALAATGLKANGGGLGAGTAYIYVAVRRQNRQPTSGAQVFNTVLRTGTGAAANVGGLGFSPDLALNCARGGGQRFVWARFWGGGKWLKASSSNGRGSGVDTLTGWDWSGGVRLGADSASTINAAGANYANWFFRRAPGFMDMVEHSAATVPHALGVAPEMILTKLQDSDADWVVYHNALATNHTLRLNSSAAKTTNTFFTALPDAYGFSTAVTTVGGVASVTVIDGGSEYHSQPAITFSGGGGSGAAAVADMGNYVATLVSPATGGQLVSGIVHSNICYFDLPYLPQPYIKNGNGTGAVLEIEWREPPFYLSSVRGYVQSVTVTNGGSGYTVAPTFECGGLGPGVFTSSVTIADGKVTGVEVLTSEYQTSYQSGTSFVGGDGTGAMADAAVRCYSTYQTGRIIVVDGGSGYTHDVSLGFTGGLTTGGVYLPTDTLGMAYTNYVPAVYSETWSVTSVSVTNPGTGYTSAPAVSLPGGSAVANLGGLVPGKQVSILFATLPGVSKVGSYVGNGTTQNLDCGFAAGARFVLVKRTDAAGDWHVWDSARGIVPGNDPYVSLNTVAAEVASDDSIDPYAPGFAVNQNTATNINVSGANYIYLSIS